MRQRMVHRNRVPERNDHHRLPTTPPLHTLRKRIRAMSDPKFEAWDCEPGSHQYYEMWMRMYALGDWNHVDEWMNPRELIARIR